MEEKPPILEALKTYGSHFVFGNSFALPDDTPYGNLTLTYQAIVTRIECLNELIIELYEGFYTHQALVKSRGGWSHLHEGHKHKFETEEVVYWLRKTADELIGIVYVLDRHKSTGEYPEQIFVASIGQLFKEKSLNDKYFKEHSKLLDKLNNISNAYKHTLINAQLHAHVGAHEPVVFALSARNVAKDIPEFYSVGLRALLDSYNTFLKTVVNIFDDKLNLKRESRPVAANKKALEDADRSSNR